MNGNDEKCCLKNTLLLNKLQNINSVKRKIMGGIFIFPFYRFFSVFILHNSVCVVFFSFFVGYWCSVSNMFRFGYNILSGYRNRLLVKRREVKEKITKTEMENPVFMLKLTAVIYWQNDTIYEGRNFHVWHFYVFDDSLNRVFHDRSGISTYNSFIWW